MALQVLYSVVVGSREPHDALREVVGEDADGQQRAFVEELALGTLEYASSANRHHSRACLRRLGDRAATDDRSIALRDGYIRTALPPRNADCGGDQ